MLLAEGKFLFRSGNFKSAFWFSWSLGRLEIDCSRVMPIHKLFSKIHRFKQVYFTKYRNTQTNLLIMKCWKIDISFISSLCYIPLSFMLVTPHLNPTQGEVISWNFFSVWRGNLKIIVTSNSSEELVTAFGSLLRNVHIHRNLIVANAADPGIHCAFYNCLEVSSLENLFHPWRAVKLTLFLPKS